MIVIPTLDGVNYNVPFLELLAQNSGQPVCVRSGWRRPRVMLKDTAFRYREKMRFWKLILNEQGNDF